MIFSKIDWSNGPYFIKTQTDITGGTSYNITSAVQLPVYLLLYMLKVPRMYFQEIMIVYTINLTLVYTQQQILP